MRTRTRARARAIAVAAPPPGLLLAGLIGLAGAALWAGAMIQRAALVAAYGPICTIHGANPIGHCPSCYAAVGLIAAAGGLAAWSLKRAASRG